MEVRQNKALAIAMLFSAVTLTGVLAIFHYGEQSQTGVYERALKFKQESSRSVSSAIVFREHPDSQRKLDLKKKKNSIGHREVAESRSSEKMESSAYGQELDSLGPDIAERLPELEKARGELVKSHRKRGEVVPFHLSFSPELNISLSIILGVKPSSLSRHDVDKLQFESEQWYFVKAFSGSEDFKILLKQGRLSRESLDPSKLKKLYGSAHHFALNP